MAIIQWMVEQFGRRQAAVYRETLIDALSALSVDPFVADSHARDEIQPGLHTLHVARHGRRGRHFLLYRTSGRGTIDILRILHDSMDVAEPVNRGETDRLANYWVGITSAGRLIQAGPGRDGGSGSWRTKRSGCAA